MTMDEQLIPFRGRCSFRQCMPSKPAKYGLTIWWNCDSVTWYPLEGEVYLRRQPGIERQVGLGATVVTNTTRPWLNTRRNVVCDSFVTSIPLPEDLLQQHATIFGTHSKKQARDTSTGETQQWQGRDVFCLRTFWELHTFILRSNKREGCDSSFHRASWWTVWRRGQKPKMILYYNEKKGRVNNMDHLASIFTYHRNTNRWTMVLFYNMLGVTGVAAFIIWVSLNPDWAQQNASGRRRMSLQELGHTLTDEHLTACMQNPSILQPSVKLSLRILGKLDAGQAQGPPHGAPVRKRCKLYPGNTDRKTADIYAECHRNVCTNHAPVMWECSD